MAITLNAGNLSTYLNDAVILAFLERNLKELRGTVLDIGSGRQRYKPLIESGGRKYVGLDLDPGKHAYDVTADLYWDGVRMDVPDNTYAGALLLEVLEHCADPPIVVGEAYRVIKPGGVLLFSTPFLYPLHETPYDFQRLTPYGAQKLFTGAGFAAIHIEAGGALDASLGQMLAVWIRNRPMPTLARRILSRIYVPVFKLLLRMDKKHVGLPPGREGVMISGVLGLAHKPL